MHRPTFATQIHCTWSTGAQNHTQAYILSTRYLRTRHGLLQFCVQEREREGEEASARGAKTYRRAQNEPKDSVATSKQSRANRSPTTSSTCRYYTQIPEFVKLHDSRGSTSQWLVLLTPPRTRKTALIAIIRSTARTLDHTPFVSTPLQFNN